MYINLLQELERLRESLEEVESSTVAQQEIRTQRENELAVLKRTLEEETAAHESAIASMRQKHSSGMEDLNNQLETAKKVRALYSVRGGLYSEEVRALYSVFGGLYSEEVRALYSVCGGLYSEAVRALYSVWGII